jgi:hypothetical protein
MCLNSENAQKMNKIDKITQTSQKWRENVGIKYSCSLPHDQLPLQIALHFDHWL